MAAVSEGIPPNTWVTSMAIGVVTDLLASDLTLRREESVVQDNTQNNYLSYHKLHIISQKHLAVWKRNRNFAAQNV